MISRFKPDIRWHDIFALLHWSSRASAIAAFEKDFAQIAGQKEAIAFPYGRTGLALMLKTLGLHHTGRNEIICPSYTCVVVPHAITLSGYKPVFVDSAADSYNMDWEFVEQATNEKTNAVIATSIFGYPIDLNALERYRALHPQVVIFQDCAHSFMAYGLEGKLVNKAGLAAFYGLNISKIITSIFGGMVTTDNAAFAQALREIRTNCLTLPSLTKSIKRSIYFTAALAAFQPPLYGMVNWLERKGYLARFANYYDPAKIDLPDDAYEGMSAVEARIGRIQCRRYESIIAHRRLIANIYLNELKGFAQLDLPQNATGATWSHFVIKTSRANEIIAHCLNHSIQLGELIEYDIPDMPAYADAPYFGERRSRNFPGQVINLPVHQGVSEKRAREITSIIKHYLNN